MKYEFISDLSYADGITRQEAAFADVKNQPSDVYLLGFEHKPVVTMGVRSSLNDLLSLKKLKELHFEVAETDRGGQSTLHMPGQLVIYPILDIRQHHLTVRSYITLLAEVTIRTFDEIGVPSFWDEERPGIYSNHGKLGAVGVRIRRGVTLHGLCLNVHNSLEPFEWLVACGTRGSSQDRLMAHGYNESLENLFLRWKAQFEFSLTSP